MGTYEAGAVGLKVISALALTTDGVPIGLLRQVFWRRPVQRSTNRHWLDAAHVTLRAVDVLVPLRDPTTGKRREAKVSAINAREMVRSFRGSASAGL